MRNLFNINSPMMQMLSKLFDWIVLNLLTVLFSLPIVTIGASTTAMYYCIDKQRRGEDNLFKDFWRGFTYNFWQATGMWLVLLAGAWVIGISIITCFTFSAPGFTVIGYIACFIGLLYLMTISWAFPLLCRFENTIGITLRNAFICMLANFFRSMMAAIVNLLPLLGIMVGLGNILIYLVMIWYAMAGNYIMWLFRKPFNHLVEISEKQYGLPDDEDDE